jgi:hypothetical protein
MKTMKRTVLFLLCVLTGSMGFAQEYFGTNTFGDTSIDNIFRSATDSNGNIYNAGLYSGSITLGSETISWSGGNADGFVSVHDSNGNPIDVFGFGGGFDDVAVDVAIDANDNMYITGYFQGAGPNSFDADPGPGVFQLSQPSPILSRDCFIIKLDSNGDFVWAKQVSNPFGFGANEDSKAIEVDSAGNVYIAGSFILADFDPDPAVDNTIFSADGGGSTDGFLLKLDTDGNFVWVKILEGPGGLVDVEDIEFDANEDILLTGRFVNNVDLDPNAGTATVNSNGNSDIFMAKWDTDGNYIWGQSFGGPGNDFVESIQELPSGVYVTGMFSGTVDLDPTAGDNTVTSNGDWDAFISQFDTTGAYQYSYTVGGEGNALFEQVYDVTEGFNGNLFITGSFIGTADFDNSANTAESTSAGITDAFIVELTTAGAYQRHFTVGGDNDETNTQITFNDNDDILMYGGFRSTDADFNPFAETDIIGTTGFFDVYMSRFTLIPNTDNDECSGAFAIACGETFTGDTSGDTDSGGNASNDEFFSFTGNGTTQIVTVSTCNTAAYDTFLRVFEDCTLTNEIAANDDGAGCSGFTSELSFVSDGTSTYYIMVEGFNAAASGAFTLSVTCEDPLPNDFCDTAQPISCGETTMGTTIGATDDSAIAPECGTTVTAPGVWYVYEDTTGLVTDITVSTCSVDTDYDTKINVYTGDCGALTCVAGNDDGTNCTNFQSEVEFQSDGNSTYYILVQGFGGATGNFSLNMECTPVPPPNDMISNAIDVDQIGFPYTDPDVAMPAATTEGGNPIGCDIDGAKGVWYKFTSEGDGEVTASIVTPAGPSSVTFYYAPDENANETDLELVQQNSNQCVAGTSAMITTDPGQSYYVYVVNTNGRTDITIDGVNLSTGEHAFNGFTMYPNPAHDMINFSAQENIENITIYSILGQKVISQELDANNAQIDVSQLASGAYIAKVSINGQVGTYKILKD